MEIFISQHNKRTGPFTPQEIHAGLASGQYQTSDLVWYQGIEGIEGWIPLSEATGIFSSDPTLQPPLKPTTSRLAIASMNLGASSFILPIAAIPAVICGHIARGKIKKSQGRLDGSGLALAGLITGYLVLGIFFIIVFLVALSAPIRKRAYQTEAISNAKHIGMALYAFEDEYGSYPNAATAKLIAEKTSTPEITGSSSNARFRQLFSAGITESEQLFYAKTPNTRKPDGNISDNEAIAPNECGFGYIDNIPPKITDSRPIAMAPFISGTTKFDPEPFGGKAVILWTDNSTRALPIDRTTGEVILDGKSILDPSHPIWAGTPPNLVLPE